VSGIVRGHEAGLKLWSEPGVGTEFKVYFPIVAEEVFDDIPVLPDDAQRGNGTILVVDDELIVARTAAMSLRKCGYAVIIARDGEQSVALSREHSEIVDLVLLDMTMPVVPGDVAFQKIGAIRPDVAVVAFSGYDEADAFERLAVWMVSSKSLISPRSSRRRSPKFSTNAYRRHRFGKLRDGHPG
jgi:CheY-like chemotaxis protein